MRAFTPAQSLCVPLPPTPTGAGGSFLAPVDINAAISRLSELSPDEQKEILRLLEELESTRSRESAQTQFMPFVKAMWPSFIEGRHHLIMADAFERIATGKIKRLIINMPPRHTKSEFASYLLPAWFLGRYPDKKIIQASHTSELAVGFGRKVRNLIDSEDYKSVFPDVSLSVDSKAAGRWNTNKRGEYFAIGVGGAIAGKGADLFIIDDPHSEQDAVSGATNPEVYNKVYEWYTTGPRQRLQPGAAIVIVMTRWSKLDLTGQILKKSIERTDVDDWEVIELPAIMPSGSPLWPQFWSQSELEKLKAELPTSRWSAQYQQNPTAEEGALIKREWWKRWTNPRPPACEALLVSWDTAFLKSQRADYSACTTWGLFYPDDSDVPNAILLDAFRDKWEFPELKRVAAEHYRKWSPDMLIVEAKAAGAPLVYELRAVGIPVTEFTPSRGQDKIARINAISDIFSSGMVWAPDERWADDVIEECAAFPNGEHDDYVDTVSQALLRFRQGGLVRTPSDDWEKEATAPRRYDYY